MKKVSDRKFNFDPKLNLGFINAQMYCTIIQFIVLTNVHIFHVLHLPNMQM